MITIEPTKKILGLRAVKAAFELIAEVQEVYLNKYIKSMDEISRYPAVFLWDDPEKKVRANRLARCTFSLQADIIYADKSLEAVSEALDFISARIDQIVLEDSTIKTYFPKFEESGDRSKEFVDIDKGILVVKFDIEYMHPWGDPFSLT